MGSVAARGVGRRTQASLVNDPKKSELPADFSRRAQGLVWVGDLAKSSTHLNDDRAVDELEVFLPRLLWIAAGVVDAAGGRFLKWTGDGFLAWFDVALHRNLGERALSVLNAAWHLSFLVNVTRLGVNPQRKFRLRHGIAYEQDGLRMTLTPSTQGEFQDVIGRAVVLAFRMSGIETAFPGVVTQGTVVRAAREVHDLPYKFVKLKVNSADRLKYFKGEARGTTDLYESADRRPRRRRSLEGATRMVSQTMRKAEGQLPVAAYKSAFSERYQMFMQSGPEWCRLVWLEEHRFLHRMFDVVQELGTLIRNRGTEPPSPT